MIQESKIFLGNHMETVAEQMNLEKLEHEAELHRIRQRRYRANKRAREQREQVEATLREEREWKRRKTEDRAKTKRFRFIEETPPAYVRLPSFSEVLARCNIPIPSNLAHRVLVTPLHKEETFFKKHPDNPFYVYCPTTHKSKLEKKQTGVIKNFKIQVYNGKRVSWSEI